MRRQSHIALHVDEGDARQVGLALPSRLRGSVDQTPRALSVFHQNFGKILLCAIK